MSDDKARSGGQDRNHIGLSKDYAVRDGAAKFGEANRDIGQAIIGDPLPGPLERPLDPNAGGSASGAQTCRCPT